MDALRQAAELAYGTQRAKELETKIAEVAGWLKIVDERPLDLLDEEPDPNAA